MPITIVRNDITRMEVDAIVNAANNSLLGGGGVDGAIHRAAGPQLLEACRKIGGCETGDAKITWAYDLDAIYVIHTVGPVWHGGDEGEAELLASCYRRSLELAITHDCRSVAFPLISAGAYGYPKEQALRVAWDTISDYLAEKESELEVSLVVFNTEAFRLSSELADDIDSFIDDHYVAAHEELPLFRSARREDAERRNRRGLFSLGGASRNAAAESTFAGSATSKTAPEPEACDAAAASAGAVPDDACFAAAHADTASADACFEAADAAALWGFENQSLDDALSCIDESFSEALLRTIDERGLSDTQCYKRANVSRQLFSKIRSNKDYRPSKPTALAFCIALEFDLAQTDDLLRKAGLALSPSEMFDVVVAYYISHRVYDLLEINTELFRRDLPLIGA